MGQINESETPYEETKEEKIARLKNYSEKIDQKIKNDTMTQNKKDYWTEEKKKADDEIKELEKTKE